MEAFWRRGAESSRGYDVSALAKLIGNGGVLRTAFQKVDEDHSGRLDYGELRQALVLAGAGTLAADDEAFKAVCHATDANGDEEITFTEFMNTFGGASIEKLPWPQPVSLGSIAAAERHQEIGHARSWCASTRVSKPPGPQTRLQAREGNFRQPRLAKTSLTKRDQKRLRQRLQKSVASLEKEIAGMTEIPGANDDGCLMTDHGPNRTTRRYTEELGRRRAELREMRRCLAETRAK